MSFLNKKKCFKCLKKTLYHQKCKCDNDYCFNCLPYFNHNCSFDWKSEKKKDLTIKNPQINFIKVENI